ncbi:CLUMA_CG012891, isoform A [Clunio marinus]|uniref:Iron-sulfur cluster assembly 2 homolog, mitochondrial n=1 Tax=Clunio marinus TaxID=568069 RepID=A0A1J1III5_9DIPT|nr:CLUMA_CG012891, isoform A [Clunio marinus]
MITQNIIRQLLRTSRHHVHQRKCLSITQKLSTETAAKTDLKLSDSCVKKLHEICKDGSFLRVIVEGGGCSGFQYKLEIDKNLNPDDLQFGPDGAKVVIDEVSVEYVDGSTVDYHEELIRAGFRIINNPKAEGGCSCGASFNIKID